MSPNELSVALKWHTYGHPPGTDFADFLAIAREAEELGYDGLFPIDHLVMPDPQILGFSAVADLDRPYFPEPWTSLAAAAAVTSRIALGPQVTPISLRHPVFVAWLATTVEQISHGRVILQVGTGWNRTEYENFGFTWPESFQDRMTALLDGLDVVERLWTSEEPVNLGGTYPLKDARLWPNPVHRPRPPIWFGGTSRAIRRATGARGDGWCPAVNSIPGGPSGFRALFDDVRASAAEAGRDPDAILPGGLVWVVVDRDRERAHDRAAVLRRREEWAARTTDELVADGVAVIGTPEDCRRLLQGWLDGGLRHLTVGLLPIAGLEPTLESMRLFATEVVPRLELRGAA